MEGVSLVRRSVALCAALFVAAYPLALERCRTACAGNAAPSSTVSTHACHEGAPSEPSVSPVPQACGHSDEARSTDITGLSASKQRADVAPAIAVAAVSIPLHDVAERLQPSRTALRSSAGIPRHLPLRV